jgi:hypothetical protein
MFRIKSAMVIHFRPVEREKPCKNQGEIKAAAFYPARRQGIVSVDGWR